MKKLILLATVLAIPSLMGFAYFLDRTVESPIASNSAAKLCLDLGYSYRLDKNTNQGVCEFPDGSRCNEWDFYNKKCGQKWLYGYEVLNCSNFGNYRNYYRFDEKSKTIYAFITVNCGSDEILVEKRGKIRIIERDYDGIILRCLCQKEVRIYNVSDFGVEFVNLWNESTIVEKEKTQEEVIGFCGISTFAGCKEDSDCKIGGCSGQLCMGLREEIFTTCEYRECYDYLRFNMSCKCFDHKCQWVKS